MCGSAPTSSSVLRGSDRQGRAPGADCHAPPLPGGGGWVRISVARHAGARRPFNGLGGDRFRPAGAGGFHCGAGAAGSARVLDRLLGLSRAERVPRSDLCLHMDGRAGRTPVRTHQHEHAPGPAREPLWWGVRGHRGLFSSAQWTSGRRQRASGGCGATRQEVVVSPPPSSTPPTRPAGNGARYSPRSLPRSGPPHRPSLASPPRPRSTQKRTARLE